MTVAQETRLLRCGLVGAHLDGSRLGAALEMLCFQSRINLHFEAIDTARGEGDFDSALASARTDGWTGLSVTHPYKAQAHAVADTLLYPPALGASNLLLLSSERLVAHNTDHAGFLGAWAEVFGTAPPGRVAIAGAGGIARAVTRALLHLGADRVTVWDTAPGRAQALAAEADDARVRWVDLGEARDAAAQAHGLVNATPAGMTAYPGSAFDPRDMGGQSWAFDAVYAPLETEFLGDARAAGMGTLTGFDLFRHMAVASYAALTGEAQDERAAERLRPLAQGL